MDGIFTQAGSGATELVTLDNHGINLARLELALVPQPPVPLRQKHAQIGSSVGIQSEAAELQMLALAE
jgi:hypothetical protein